jgi:hypothetical protein
MPSAIRRRRRYVGSCLAPKIPSRIPATIARRGRDAPPLPNVVSMESTSLHAGPVPDEKGIWKISEEKTTASKPAKTDVPTYQRTTLPAKRPASPRRTSMAMAGLKATRISNGTSITTAWIRAAVPLATGASGSGKAPPRNTPVARATKVQM